MDMIPKIIHYCWLSDNKIPLELQKYMETWKVILPDYEFMLWDLKRFDINSSRWVKEAFDNKKYAFAADYIRLYAVYNYGGIYMDMDVEVIKKFDDLLYNDYFFGYDRPGYLEAGIFGTSKGNVLVKDVLDYYCNRSFVLENGTFDMKTLPCIFMEVLRRKYQITGERLIDTPGMIYVHPMDFFTARDWPYRNVQVTNNTYTVHHFAGSWLPLHRRILSKTKNVLIKVVGAKATERIERILKLRVVKERLKR